MSTFKASQTLVNVHNWRRYAIAGDAPATNSFNAEFSTSAGRGYFVGAVSVGAVFFILAILLLVILSIVNIVVCCCCRTSAKKVLANTPQQRSVSILTVITSPTAVWLAAVVFICAVALGAVAQVPVFRDGLNDTAGAITAFAGLLLQTSAGVSQGIAGPLANATAIATAFCATAPSQNPPPTAELLQAICALPGPLGTAATTTTTVATSLTATSSALASQLAGGGTFDLTNLSRQVYTGGVTLIAFFAAYILSTPLGLMRTKCCAGIGFRVCNCVLLFVLAGVYVVTGVFAIVGVVGSDVCAEPSASLSSVANMTSSGGSTYDTVRFYTSCNPSVTYTNATGSYGQFLQGQAQIANASAAVAALAQVVPVYPWAGPFVTGLTRGLQAAADAAATISRSVSCGPIATIIVDILDALCNKGIMGAVMMFQLCAAVCAFMGLLAILAVSLCRQHPGEPSADTAAENPVAALKTRQAAM